jgi:hypothetical protein
MTVVSQSLLYRASVPVGSSWFLVFKILKLFLGVMSYGHTFLESSPRKMVQIVSFLTNASNIFDTAVPVHVFNFVVFRTVIEVSYHLLSLSELITELSFFFLDSFVNVGDEVIEVVLPFELCFGQLMSRVSFGIGSGPGSDNFEGFICPNIAVKSLSGKFLLNPAPA